MWETLKLAASLVHLAMGAVAVVFMYRRLGFRRFMILMLSTMLAGFIAGWVWVLVDKG